jgi:hypothetical protein
MVERWIYHLKSQVRGAVSFQFKILSQKSFQPSMYVHSKTTGRAKIRRMGQRHLFSLFLPLQKQNIVMFNVYKFKRNHIKFYYHQHFSLQFVCVLCQKQACRFSLLLLDTYIPLTLLHVYQNYLSMRNTIDVTGAKPITV